MSPLDFVAKYVGQRITSAGGIGGQCVDLSNQYIYEAVGDQHVFRNALDWAGLAVPHFRWVPNSPINFPEAGSLVVWGPNVIAGTGAFGHIALALYASPARLLTFDQNWPEMAPALLRVHTYDGVLGWQAPTR